MPKKDSNSDEFLVTEEPFYQSVGGEIATFDKAYSQRLPVLLKGPTGTGKTRFLEYMAWKLKKPLITVACHEDLTASDLVGRFLLKGNETVWQDGPLTVGVKIGAIVYLDEVVEARKDTIAFIHPLTDHRRILPIDKLQTQIKAHKDFNICVSYNPGYQALTKDMKPSTKQRFVAIEFGFPEPDLEKKIIFGETNCKDNDVVEKVVFLGTKIRGMGKDFLQEHPSTRLLIYAVKLIQAGMNFEEACKVGIIQALSDDIEVQKGMNKFVEIL